MLFSFLRNRREREPLEQKMSLPVRKACEKILL